MKREDHLSIKMSNTDKEIIHALEIIVEGVAKSFGKNCEVVLHSLEDIRNSVIKIENGHVTGRKIGSPLTDFAIELLKEAESSGKNVTDIYFSKLDDGRLLKSVTTLIRNTEGKPIGLLCINIDLSAPFVDVLKELLPSNNELANGKTLEHFPATTKELIHNMLGTVMVDVNLRSEIPVPEKGRAIVAELYKKGIFNVKGALDLVAKEIGVSRYTVYNYIREAKANHETSG